MEDGGTGGFSTPDMERMIVLQPVLILGNTIPAEEVVSAWRSLPSSSIRRFSAS